MAKVLLKKSSVSSNAPGTGDLDYGELAINYADGRLYYKNSSNQIKNFVDSDVVITQINARTPLVLDTTPQLGGTLDANGNNIDMGVNLITDTKVGQWDTAYSWGDHSTQGYLTAADALDSAEALALFSGGTGITFSSGTISTNDNQIVHDNLSGFVANEHIDHSTVSITAGNGLTGGGTIAASRTLNVGAGTGVTVTADAVSIGQDVATTANVTFNNINNNGWLDLKHDSNADLITHSEGRMFYHNEYKTLTVLNDISDVALQVGLENWIRVYNNSGSTITNGTPVYITGANGETPTVAASDATTEAKAYVIGIATHDITNLSEGFVTHFGLVSGLNTSALTQGSAVHVGPDGSLQNAAPTYPYFPTEVGTCIVSDSSNGYLLVDVRHHTFERFRVTGNQFVGGNLTVDGDLTVNGTQSIVSQANLAVDTSFIYTNSGDTIGSSNTNFTGSGLNDAVLTGHYTGTTTNKHFYVRIDGVGTGTGGVDTFEWSLDNFSTTEATGVDITASNQLLADGISVNFNAATGHTSGDVWDGTASPVNVDAGFASNRNTGTSGVGYTHMGAFFDVTDEKWKFFKSYDPEPEGSINTSDSSYEKATIDANLEGNVTGNLTGNASTATSATTATKLATARTISLTGDVTGSTSFDGSGNVSITATVADDSHNHIISNVDGLQTALDDKVDLTGGTMTGALNFGDTVKAQFGTGNDLQIYHDGSNSYIDEQGTGLLFVRGSQIRIDGPTGSQLASFSNAGTSVLFYNGSQKLSTNSVGVGITGLLTASSVSVTGNIGVTGTVDGRDIAADGTKLDGIEAGATGDQTASEILTAIKTVDGATSGLDADLLDGQHGSYYRIDVYDASGTLLN